MEAQREPGNRSKWAQAWPTSRPEWRAFAINLLHELGIVFLSGVVYVVVRKVTEGTPERGLEHARQVLRIESALGLRHELGVQRLVLDHPDIRTFANWVYIWGHWPVITVVCIGLYVIHHPNYVRLRNAILVSGSIGFLFFALFPTAPPRLTSFGYVDTISVWSSSYRVMQPPRYTNLYAAMPSLHFGWDLLVGMTLLVSVRNPWLRAFGVAMPTAMAFAVVATGNHWILDVLVAVLVVGVAAGVSEGLRLWRGASVPIVRRDATGERRIARSVRART